MAIQIRRGTNANWESNYSNIVDGEPAITTDTERFMVGTSSGAFAEFANVEVLADEFDANHSYIVGEPCTYKGKIQVCTTPHSGAWNSSHFSPMSLNDALLSASDYLELARLMASDYNPNADYFEGQFTKQGGNIYEAKQDITAEAWNASHWNLIGAAS